MNRDLLGVLGLWTIASATLAQQFQYDGEWAMRCPRIVVIELKGNAGTFTPYSNRAEVATNPCARLTKPVVVQSATAEKLVLEVKGSVTLLGCADFTLTLIPIDATHLEGTRSGAETQACSGVRK